MSSQPAPLPTLQQRVVEEQVRAHYSHIPAMVLAPSVGGLFTAWVLWDAVRNVYLVIGMSLVLLLSAGRLVLYRRYFASAPHAPSQQRWKVLAVLGAIISGCIWGSAAPFLYPPAVLGYEVYLLVLLTLLPIVPVAALAVYMPAFYGYYIPCITPFVVTLALAGSRPELMTALLLVMMMMAMLTFARRYSHGFAEAIALKLQLAEKSEELQRAIHHKSRFIAAASHDLRHPVQAMGLFLHSLNHRGSVDSAAQEIAHLQTSLDSLRGMLDDMLEISRLDADVVAAHQFEFEAGDLLQKVHDEYAPLAERRQLRCVLRVQPAVIRSDPVLLERVLRNLLSNALKFTRQGGVALVSRPQGAAVRLQVIDTGTGIPASHLDQVFDEFAQLDNADRDSTKGLGLGLAIVQRLTRLMDHKVRVRSVLERGSVFTVEVPRGRGTAQPLGARADSVALQAPSERRVLVIDDDDAVGASTATLVRRWGHQVLLARSGRQGLAALAANDNRVDLMIVDYRLADGETAFDAIARVERGIGRNLPAIVLTGDTSMERVRECLAAGRVLLHKPVDPERLSACMAAACEPAAQRREGQAPISSLAAAGESGQA